MKEVKWYACKKDIGITLILIFFAFMSWPWLSQGWTDFWPLTILYIFSMVFIESLLICRKHFWAWIFIATYGVWLACLMGRSFFISSSYLVKTDMQTLLIDFVLNGLVFLVFILPVVMIVFRYRGKRIL